jgi:hypothetical protein
MSKAEKILQLVLVIIILAIFIVALCSCAPMYDALMPHEMHFDYHRGVIKGAEGGSGGGTPYPPIDSVSSPGDNELYWFGVGFTWHLRNDVRDEIRALRKEIGKRGVQRDN